MTRILVRHGLSEANNRNNLGNLAFASADAPLMNEGITQANAAGRLLVVKYGASILTKTVAVSTMRRTQETATAMGLRDQVVYPELQEVAHDMDLVELRHMLDRGGLPDAAVYIAQNLLENPPAESIWVTHGLVIAGLCSVLGVEHEDWRLIPRFCEIRELPIS